MTAIDNSISVATAGTLTVQAGSGTEVTNVNLSLRSSCLTPSSEVACSNNYQLTASVTPGTYYLWVDTPGAGGQAVFYVQLE